MEKETNWSYKSESKFGLEESRHAEGLFVIEPSSTSAQIVPDDNYTLWVHFLSPEQIERSVYPM